MEDQLRQQIKRFDKELVDHERSKIENGQKPRGYQAGVQGKSIDCPEILKFFSPKTFEEIEAILGYEFKNKETLGLAFIHSSFANERNQSGNLRHPELPETLHNQRLEFLGDAILQTMISSFLYKNLPDHSEGELTEMRSYIVGHSVCTYYSIKLGLENYILTGGGDDLKVDGRKNMLTDLFEAVLGALYIDGGMDTVERFFYRNFHDDLFKIINSPKYNFKKALQDFISKTCDLYPAYVLVEGEKSELGVEPDEYRIELFIGGDKVGEGTGKSKQAAEQEAAARGLAHISASYQAYFLDMAHGNSSAAPSSIAAAQTINDPELLRPVKDPPSGSQNPVSRNMPADPACNTPMAAAEVEHVGKPINTTGMTSQLIVPQGGAIPNYKGILKERLEKIYHRKDCIDFKLIHVDGPKHCQKWFMEIFVMGVKVGEGCGRSKKRAQQDAARDALEKEERGELVLPTAPNSEHKDDGIEAKRSAEESGSVEPQKKAKI